MLYLLNGLYNSGQKTIFRNWLNFSKPQARKFGRSIKSTDKVIIFLVFQKMDTR